MQGEAAGESEAVQGAPAGITGGSEVVLALIEKDAGLLAAQEIGVEGQPVEVNSHPVRNVARQGLRFQGEPFLSPYWHVVPRRNACRGEQCLETRDDLGKQPVHALVEGLHDEIIAVTVDDQARQAVGLAVNQAIGIGAGDDPLPKSRSRLDAAGQKIPVDRLGAAAQQAQCDLG